MRSKVPNPKVAVLNKRDSYPGLVADTGVSMGRGVLRPGLAATRFQLARRPPSSDLAPFVDFYWILRWDLRGRGAHEQTILPHPSVNLAFEPSGAGIYGVDRRLFTRSLSGSGLVLGVRFRAGCFRPFWRAPISELTNRVVPAVRIFGPEAEETRRAIMRAGAACDGVDGSSGVDGAGGVAGSFADADTVMTEHAEALLRSVRPERDAAAEQAAELVARITGDPALRRVDQLAAASGMSARSLQRLFADYVGVSPKWVMRRARLHEAAERADGGELVDWAELAADLGYADQAHLTRDFTATIGIPPTHYAAAPGPVGRADPLGRAGPLGRGARPIS
jgi:AraC-like DNA-binding protein